MNPDTLLELLTALQQGKTTPGEVLGRLVHLPFEDLEFAKIDHHRTLRTGMPEVIYAAGKTDEQVVEIFEHMAQKGGNVLATRVSPGAAKAVCGKIPATHYHAVARTLALCRRDRPARPGPLAVLCAGTSDLPVAEEAAITAETMGNTVIRLYDVGVAGLHRLLAQRKVITEARAIIVCAGMEGALPTVVAGLVRAPVIAVPTSVGYGASFGGITALLACSIRARRMSPWSISTTGLAPPVLPPRSWRQWKQTITPKKWSPMPWFNLQAEAIPRVEIENACQRMLDEARARIKSDLRRVLLLPPDLTRAHSGSGWITETIYHLLPKSCDIHVIPTLGQHVPHTEAENKWMFGSIPHERIHAHDWRNGVVRVGTIPASLVRETTGGKADWDIPVDLNDLLMKEDWDLIVNIGHVVPHEVLGFANHNKNYFIGLGGKETICASHIAAGIYGIENNLGNLITPLRACYNWAEDQFLGRLPDVYFQVVMKRDPQNRLVHTGVFVGDDLETYLQAARLSREVNITTFDKPVKKIVAHMQGDEFRSTWVANKAVYRTRMAMADGGELLIIAPGLERFGEQPDVDALIRKYGYLSTRELLDLYRKNADLQDLAHGAAHLIHGTSDGRFTIRYAPGHLTRAEIEQVNFAYGDYHETLKRYPIDRLKEGWNTMPDGEEIFYISTPSAGLWSTKQRLERATSS